VQVRSQLPEIFGDPVCANAEFGTGNETPIDNASPAETNMRRSVGLVMLEKKERNACSFSLVVVKIVISYQFS
jgi:hypothetical protein